MIDFAKAIRLILIDNDMSQKQLAEMLDMSKQQFSTFMYRGDYKINKDIISICDLLGYDVELILINRKTNRTINCK